MKEKYTRAKLELISLKVEDVMAESELDDEGYLEWDYEGGL